MDILKIKNNTTGIITEISDSPFLIGRNVSCHLVITSSKHISRVHCILKKVDDHWILSDESTNGTFLNGNLLISSESPPICNEDRISFFFDDLGYTLLIDPFEVDTTLDEQLCNLADTLLQQSEPQNSSNVNDSVIFVENVDPPTLNRPLTRNMKTDCLSPSKKLKTSDKNDTPSSSVDLTEASSSNNPSSSVKVKNSSIKIPENLEGCSEIKELKAEAKATENKLSEIKLPKNNQNEEREHLEAMENELQCAICSELFVKAVTLSCSHSYCKYCIDLWRKTKSDCPICRAKINSIHPTLVLDNIIEKMVENSSEEEKAHRKELLEARNLAKQSQERQKRREVSNLRGGRARGRGRARSSRPRIIRGEVQPVTVIEVSSDSDTDSSLMDTDYGDNWPDNESWHSSENYDDAEYDSGEPGAYYGGYGHCYSCGMAGHWANGCPYR